jgi:RNA polymerase sigma factor (sigma-70 family)
MITTFSEEAIIESIEAGGQKRQRAIALIYEDRALKNQIVAFVKSHNGNHEDGVDVFHEGIIAFDKNIRGGNYKGEGKLKGYLYSTCRFIWLNKLKRNKKIVYTAEESQLDQVLYETPESLSLAEEQKKIIASLLGQLDQKCGKILELWKLSYSMDEIAQQVGLKDGSIARRQKYNCYQKLLQIVDKAPNLKNILK